LATPSDSSPGPGSGRVVDPGVLAARRARRAGEAEPGPPERAQPAEGLAAALRRRLGAAESALARAGRERAALEADLRRSERELTGARQREFAEQRRRAELEEELFAVRRELESEIAGVRAAHREAEGRAEELALILGAGERDRDQARAELESIRRELDRRGAAYEALGAQIVELGEAFRRTETEQAGWHLGSRVAARPPPGAPGSPICALVPPADHPALARSGRTATSPDAAPPAVIVELTRAATRLRAAGDPAARVAGERAMTPAAPLAGERTAPGTSLTGERAVASGRHEPGPDSAERGPRLPAAFAAAPPARPWLGPALVAFATGDAAAAEGLLVAFLAVHAARVDRSLDYELELPVTGCHRVRLRPGNGVEVAPGSALDRAPAFSVGGPIAALAVLAAGAAPRRPPGITLRGRRRPFRGLLRALRAPVGLPELQAAGSRPRPGDLLALLCHGVRPEAVRGADFGVAYVVGDADGPRTRTLVRAQPHGSLTVIPEAPGEWAADATVTVSVSELLGVLAGTEPVAPEGDALAVATLQRWLRGVQGLPA